MSTRGQFNTKNPTIKRILKEASELASNASPDYHAEPLEDNLFEWHFTLKGPPEPSPYDGGIYHGRIVLPAAYPLRPPSFRFLTPTGRFEVNREICLSISGHHEETWQPAWGIRTALVAIRSFMDTDAKGQLGGIDCGASVRKKMAAESGPFRCGACGRSNSEIMAEREEAAKLYEATSGKHKEEDVPEELRLAYRDELGNSKSDPQSTGAAVATSSNSIDSEGQVNADSSSQPRPATVQAKEQPVRTAASTSRAPRPTRTTQTSRVRRGQSQAFRRDADHGLAWIDACIYGVVAALLFMVLRRFV
ncbi:UBC-like protein [Aaosphaeria arxii CBS 175.79]|uniref:UBC-like protein n=1 Tax=Aaosphaeria arxii CBS 175.79 TaxID=1450172 RepID=A0A6A5XNI7_9PLEO|nr:UBC-like protein [Aaosphaeria arxii CBS 175.79]KAF2014825.1 UBC-like protein [Aaosphaeria arxii CBS 175.79]